MAHDVGRAERVGEVGQGQPVRCEPCRIRRDQHRPVRRADGIYVARAWDALEFRLQRVRDFCQLARTIVGIVAPQRQRHHRHIVDALGFDDRGPGAEVARQPVLVGKDLVVEPHQRSLAFHSDLELHRDQSHARAAGGIGVPDLLDLGQLLLQRERHQLLDLARIGAGEGHDDVGHGHVDLRLFLARSDQRRDDAEEQAQQCQDRR